MRWHRSGIRRAFRSGAHRAKDAKRDVTDEMQLHIELRAEQLERQGLDPAAAKHEAERLFAQNHDTLRDLYATADDRNQHMRWREKLESLLQDIRYAARALMRDRIVTVFILLTLALGIGANVTAFSMVDRLLLRDPAYVRDPGQLVRVLMRVNSPPAGVTTTAWIPYKAYLGVRSAMRTVQELEVYRLSDDLVGKSREGHKRRIGAVSGGFFPLLGVNARAGRMFNATEDASRSGPLAVLSDQLWKTEFGSDPQVIGQMLVVGELPHTIVGIAPPEFTGVERARVDVWTLLDNRSAPTMNWWIVGRLRANVTLAAASTDADAAHRVTAEMGPKWTREATFLASPIAFGATGEEPVETVTARWMASVSVVILLIACANVTNLLLARLARRRRELAIRVALGSGRGRVMRLLALEGALLAVGAAIASLAVIAITEPAVRLAIFPDAGWTLSFGDWRILSAVGGVTLLTGLLVGVFPAWQAGSAEVTSALRTGVREGGNRSGLRTALTVVQATLSVLLLIGAGLFLRSLAKVSSVDLGMDINQVLTAEARFPRPTGTFREQEAMERQRYRQLIGAVRRLPGVERASVVTGVPFLQGFGVTLVVPGLDTIPGLPGGSFQSAVSTDYFETIGTRVLRGRTFTEQDREGSEPVVIVAETMARTLWPKGNAMGSCIQIGGTASPCSRVVGIAEDVHHSGLHEEPSMQYYVPTGQERGFYGSMILVRTKTKATASWPALQKAILAVDPTIRGVELRLLTDALNGEVRPLRLGMVIFGLSGALALLVAALGLYSVMSYMVAWRTHEIGVRLALGASDSQIARLVIASGTLLASIGIGVGLLLAIAARGWIQPRLFETSATDPLVFLGVAVALFTVSLLAGWLPTRRALRISPTEALRSE